MRPYASDSDDSGDEGADFDVEKLGPLEVGPGEHKLQHTYYLWFGKKGSHRAAVSAQSQFVHSLLASDENVGASVVFPSICRNTSNRCILWDDVRALNSGGHCTVT